LDQTRYIAGTQDPEFVDLEVAKLFLKICAFCEEERHVIMDCPFVPFHISYVENLGHESDIVFVGKKLNRSLEILAITTGIVGWCLAI
jgi:hypothetical protein